MAAAAPKLALISAGLAAVGLLGAYFGLLSPMAGFSTFVSGCLLGGAFSTLVALVGLFLTRGGMDPTGRTRALVGLAIALGLLIIVFGAASTGGDAPPINDITTDLSDPPNFSHPAVASEYADRDMSYPVDFVAIVQRSYPDLSSIDIDVPAEKAYHAALSVAESLGWEILVTDRSEGLIYAKDETSIFRFVDDVVVRIRPNANGARIDVRSKSRDGQGDLGANAKRIRALLGKIDS